MEPEETKVEYILPFEKEDLQISGLNDKFSVKICPDTSSGCMMVFESYEEGRQWSEKFSDLSSFCDNSDIKIPNEMVLDSMIKALSNFNSENMEGKDLKPKPQCSLGLSESTLSLALNVPLGISTVSYNFPLPALEFDKTKFVERKCLRISDRFVHRSEDLVGLKKEMNEFRADLREFKRKIEAFMFHDSVTLKEMGFTAFQLRNAGFTTEEVLQAWHASELRNTGFFRGSMDDNPRRLSRMSLGDRTSFSIRTYDDSNIFSTADVAIPEDSTINDPSIQESTIFQEDPTETELTIDESHPRRVPNTSETPPIERVSSRRSNGVLYLRDIIKWKLALMMSKFSLVKNHKRGRNIQY